LDEIWRQSVFLCLEHIEHKKSTVLPKVPEFPPNSDFGPFLSQNSRSGNILDVFKLNDIASATLYPSFATKIKALLVLVLKI